MVQSLFGERARERRDDMILADNRFEVVRSPLSSEYLIAAHECVVLRLIAQYELPSLYGLDRPTECKRHIPRVLCVFFCDVLVRPYEDSQSSRVPEDVVEHHNGQKQKERTANTMKNQR